MTTFEFEPEGRCSYCHHIRSLKEGMLREHHYLGSAICPGSGKPPMEPPLNMK